MLGPRFDDALAFTASLHRKQTRKGNDVPYMSHLLAVASLVIEYGGDEEQAIAALLHDAIEDQATEFGEPGALDAEIRCRYGESVLEIVRACSDSDGIDKRPWRERKEAYLAHIASTETRAAFVSNADKLHNLRSILADVRLIGNALFDRFNAERDDVLWYYRELVRAYDRHHPSRLSRELRRTFAELNSLCKALDAARDGKADGAFELLEHIVLGQRVPGETDWIYFLPDGTLVAERGDRADDARGGAPVTLLTFDEDAKHQLALALGLATGGGSTDGQTLLAALARSANGFRDVERLVNQHSICARAHVDHIT